MVDAGMTDRARTLRALHARGVLVLPNVWDAAGAERVVRAGAAAVATTSGGVAWSFGRSDGEGLTRDEMMSAVRRICAAVDVPVTADVEAGYGPSPEDVAVTVRAAIAAGAVGVNIEDARNGQLLTVEAQASRLRAARAAAAAAGLPEFVINARTDVYLVRAGQSDAEQAEGLSGERHGEHGGGERPGGQSDAGQADGHGAEWADVLVRAAAYAEAGADCLFVPGLLDLTAWRELTTAVSLPVNAMTGPGGPSVADLVAAGVRRVSAGTSLAEAAYDLVERTARDLLASGAGH